MANFRITAVHMVGGNGHEHIALLYTADQWVKREDMVSEIDNPNGNRFYVTDAQGNTVWVDTVHASPAYVRTYRDGTPTDNLLYLPGGSFARAA
jgi:hypothetical protein